MSTKAIAIGTLTVLAATPIIATIWLRRKRNDFAERVSTSTKIDTAIPSRDDVKSLPRELLDAPKKYVLSIEHAAKVVPKASIPSDLDQDGILVHYLRANMQSFTYTPQSPLLKFMCKSASAKQTFEHEYVSQLGFEVGDLVCGVFRVVLKEQGRIEMALDPDKSFAGPREGDGRLVARLVESGDGKNFVFMNDTIMWRKRHGGKPAIIESRLSGWLHEIMVMWLIDSGTKAVVESYEIAS